MGNRFAGAADLAERRRRRLAGADEESVLVDAAPTFAPVGEVPDQSAAETSELSVVRRAISPRLWKHLVVLGLSAVTAAFLFWFQDLRTTNGLREESAELSSVTRGLAGIFLLLSAELALLIGWIRAQSQVDYQGRYRWWKFFALGVGGFAGLLLTGTIGGVPELASVILRPLTGEIVAARNAVVFVPMVAFWAIVLSRVLPDMSRCFWSQGLMSLAALAVILRFMLVHGTAQATIQPAILNGMILAASFTIFASMLLHCRFVTFVSNDPPVGHQRRPAQAAAALSAGGGQHDAEAADGAAASKSAKATESIAQPDSRDKASTTEKADTSASTGSRADKVAVAENTSAPDKSTGGTRGRRNKNRQKRRKAA